MSSHRARTRPVLRVLTATIVSAAALAATAGCGASTDATKPVAASPRATPGYTVVTAPTLRPGQPVPRPRGKVVLTLTGVDHPNVGRTLQLDLATLDSMGTVKYRVLDRQAEGHDVVFSGPLLRTVLAVAGAHGRVLHGVALNDYAVDVPAADARRFPVLLATAADGRRMSVAHYGPTRFVYPTTGYHLDKTTYDPRWIWQLTRIDVR